MAEKYEAPATYTNQEMADLATHAIAQVMSVGTAYTTVLGGGNRSVTRADLDKLRAARAEFQAAADNETYGPAVNYARFARG